MSVPLVDWRAHLSEEEAYDSPGRWPAPPLLDLDAAGSGVCCVGCALVPAHRACEACPRVSVRLWRELQAERPSRWSRLLRRARA